MRAFISRCRALGRDISLEFLDGYVLEKTRIYLAASVPDRPCHPECHEESLELIVERMGSGIPPISL